MVIALNPNRITRYELDAERGKPDSTVFVLRALTPDELAEVVDATTGHDPRTGEVRFHHGRAALIALRHALTGWERLLDERGEEVRFDADRKADMIALLPEDVRTEVARAARFGSEVTVAEGE
jgi:hypothetical protein